MTFADGSTDSCISYQKGSTGSTFRSSACSSNQIDSRPDDFSDRMVISVGSSPTSFLLPQNDTDPGANCRKTTHASLSSLTFEQACTHFCDDQMWCKTKWVANTIETSFKVPKRRASHKEPDFSKFFVLHWSQMRSPSAQVWSYGPQSQQFGTAYLGQLEISLPAVYTSSLQNFSSLYALMDMNIETVFRQRIAMRTCTLHQQYSSSL